MTYKILHILIKFKELFENQNEDWNIDFHEIFINLNVFGNILLRKIYFYYLQAIYDNKRQTACERGSFVEGWWICANI